MLHISTEKTNTKTNNSKQSNLVKLMLLCFMFLMLYANTKALAAVTDECIQFGGDVECEEIAPTFGEWKFSLCGNAMHMNHSERWCEAQGGTWHVSGCHSVPSSTPENIDDIAHSYFGPDHCSYDSPSPFGPVSQTPDTCSGWDQGTESYPAIVNGLFQKGGKFYERNCNGFIISESIVIGSRTRSCSSGGRSYYDGETLISCVLPPPLEDECPDLLSSNTAVCSSQGGVIENWSCDDNPSPPVYDFQCVIPECPQAYNSALSSCQSQGGQLQNWSCSEDPLSFSSNCELPTEEDKEKGPDCDSEGNPCSPGSGNKFESFTDYKSADGHLSLKRNYNSLNPKDGSFGMGWTSNYLQRLDVTETTIKVVQKTGRVETWNIINDGSLEPKDPDSRIVLEKVSGQFILTNVDNSVETYSDDGSLISIRERSGLTSQFEYDSNGRLSKVTGPFGRILTYQYNGNGRVSFVVTPDGQVGYLYDSTGNLIQVTNPDNSTEKYHYEDGSFPHSLTGITDENNTRFATWTYSNSGKVISSEHAGVVEKVTFAYSINANDEIIQTTVTGALGDIRVYQFDKLNGVNKVVSISGDQCKDCGNGFMKNRTYDTNGFLNGYSDWEGNQTTIINNSRGFSTQETDAVGTPEERTTTTTWHSSLNLPLTITEPKRQTTFTYTSTGQLLTQTVIDTLTNVSRTITYTYHPLGTNGGGLIATMNGPRTDINDITTYAYNSSDDLINITNALGQTTQITSHDSSGRPLTIIDANNITITLSWDLRGRLLSTDIDGSLTSFEYDLVGQLTKATQADSSFLSYTYDDAHRLTGISDNADNTITYELDKMGNRTSTSISDTTGSISYSQTAIFDKLSHLKQILGANSQSQTINYDDNHNPLNSTDALNRQNQSNYDALDRLTKSIDPDAEETNFTYDKQDNLTKVTDAKGLETVYNYNGFVEVVSQTSPDTGTTTYTYDSAGNRTSMVDARGVTVNYTFDALNRLTTVDYSDDTLDVTHNYDAGTNGVGRLISTNDASGNTTYVYDSRGNLLSKSVTIGSINHTIAYSYNDANRLTGMTYPSGNSVQYQRSNNGEITQITATIDGATQTLLSNASYKPFGPLETFTFGNGLTHTASFDSSLRLTGQTTSNIQSNDYGYNTVDNLVSFNNSLDTSLNQSFTYNALDRLSDASGDYGTFQYVFDVVGNRTQKTDNANSDNYVYGTNNHHLQNVTGTNATSYQYDANGNTTDNGNYQFVYGQDNRLHQATQNGVNVGDYTYNALGQRVRKITATATTLFHYDQNGNLIAESDEQGQIKRETVWFNGSPYALITNTGQITVSTPPLGTSYINSPVDRSTLSGSEHTFTWVVNGATNVNYWLEIGSSIGENDYYGENLGIATSQLVTGLPTDGSTIYARLYYNNTNWDFVDFEYTSGESVTAPPIGTSYISSPVDRSTLSGSEHTFNWEANGATNVNYWLEVGSSIGENDYYGENLGIATSQLVTGLPTDGSTIYARLYYNNTNWDFVDFEYTSGESVTTPPIGTAYISSPVDTSTLSGSEHTFNWEANGATNVNYWLEIGSSIGENDYYGENLGTATSQLVTGLPTDGSTIYARLYYNNTNWDFIDFEYTSGESINSSAVFYVHNNHQGTPEKITDENQTIVWKANYSPYGEASITTETISNNIRLPGQYFDAETGLHYNYFRYYDAGLGRYVTSDPIGLAGGINTYGYVDGNPLSFIDPFGLSKFDQFFGLPKKFWQWYHRNEKRNGDGDMGKDEAESLHEYWKDIGKPGPDTKRDKNQRGEADLGLLGWLIPWPLTPTEIGVHPCEVPGGPPCYLDELENSQCLAK